eukprot:CAMPEP_0181230168 /NCGR_PEP_ID=MMETSP1096-20121128/34314_1 /TAXON_ID=156174 ORGANISM="Chrysochromulina ericina, Strain CCMP281" /NCGR_SAMPLE_ID=MMETSP1096 /ASSEMBLY_ACC=CAM_ASM_000453 /LENGTH=86 /DNA_ID=CAMNT_0023323895 /DNA_START=134 /DNA_END=394 /DNA_ORIENTATION=-
MKDQVSVDQTPDSDRQGLSAGVCRTVVILAPSLGMECAATHGAKCYPEALWQSGIGVVARAIRHGIPYLSPRAETLSVRYAQLQMA